MGTYAEPLLSKKQLLGALNFGGMSALQMPGVNISDLFFWPGMSNSRVTFG